MSLVTEVFTQTGMKILGADFGFIWIKMPNNHGHYSLAYKSPGTPYVPQPPRTRGINARVSKNRLPFFATKIPKERNQKYDVGAHMKSFVIIPIAYKNHLYGNAVFCFKKIRYFSQTDRDLSIALGNSLAQAMTINKLNSSLQDIKHTLDHTPQPILIFNPNTLKISYFNQGLLKQTGLNKFILRRASINQIIHPSFHKIFEKKLKRILKEKILSSVFEVAIKTINNRKLPVESLIQYVETPGQNPHLLTIFSDLRERKKNEEQIKRAAFHDTLTRLPNRFLFTQRLDALLKASARYGRKFAVIFLDLDRFKEINDTAGHLIGDLLLRQVASRLKKNIKHNDIISRFGGDEFVILVPNLNSTRQADQVVSRIRKAFKKPFDLTPHQEAYINFSAGISTFPKNGVDAETLLKNADNALYRAKHRYGNSFVRVH